MLYVERVRSFRRSELVSDLDLHPRLRLPAYCTAMGKLLLANLPEPEQRGLLAAAKLAKRARNTITSKKTLREELEQIGAAGFACSDHQFAAEVVAIAVPVRNEAREVLAAVGMSVDSALILLDELAEELGPHLRAGADRISARLGYRRADEIPGAG